MKRSGAVSPPLEPLVDQEPPEILRDVAGTVDLVADHHKADRGVVGVDRPVDGMTTRILGRLDQRIGNAGHELLLDRRDAERLDHAAIRVVDRPQ